jgi:hypothetical protein
MKKDDLIPKISKCNLIITYSNPDKLYFGTLLDLKNDYFIANYCFPYNGDIEKLTDDEFHPIRELIRDIEIENAPVFEIWKKSLQCKFNYNDIKEIIDASSELKSSLHQKFASKGYDHDMILFK